MKPSLKKIIKFFDLEAERGYDNRAVLGGLDKMLDQWEDEAINDELPEEFISTVISRIRDYSRLPPKSREEILTGLIKRITTIDEAQAYSATSQKFDSSETKEIPW